VHGGTGARRAKQATHALIDAFQPTWILSVGFSGALVDGLALGEIVVGDSLVGHPGGAKLEIDLGMEPAPNSGIHVGRLCMVDHIVRKVEEKRTLAKATGAVAVDMESLAVAQVCSKRGTRFMAVRVISDDLSSDLPPEVLAILGSKVTIRAGALFGAVLKRPGAVKDLWGIREQAVEAAGHLGRFLDGTIRQLASS
jgi:adenosylhomocysteine nucleosidase